MASLKALAQQLKHEDRAERKAAIIALANTRDERVIRPLKWAYENDPDPELRDLAFRAARFIRQKTQEMHSVGDFSNLPDDLPPPGAAPANAGPSWSAGAAAAPQAGPVPVSSADEKMAAGMVERAMDLKVRGNDAKAADLIMSAFARNPNLKDNMMAVGLAADILNTDEAGALRILLNPAARNQVQGQVRAAERRAASAQTEDELYTAIFWLILYFIIYFGAIVLGWAFLDAVIDEAIAQGQLSDADREVFEQIQGLSTAIALLVATIAGTTQVFMQLLYMYAIHVVARFMLVGRGTYLGILAKMTRFNVAVTFIGVGATALSITAPDVGAALSCVWLLSIPVLIYYTMRIIAEHYGFSMIANCTTIIIAVVLLVIGNFAFNFALFSVLSGLT